MSDNILYKEITNYGAYGGIAGMLPYQSDRTISNYKKMKQHPIITLGVEYTVLGLADIPYVIECDNEDIIPIVDKMLSSIWHKTIKEACESLYYGFKPFELRYEPGNVKYKDGDDNTQIYNGIKCKSPKGIDAANLQILIEADGSLQGYKQDFATEPCLVKDKKCLIIINKYSSGNYYGESALEPAYGYWYISGINLQFHTRWLERKGTGLFIGRFPEGHSKISNIDKDNSEIMLELLDTIMEGTAVALPSGYDDKGNPIWDINLLEGQDKNDSFIQFHEYLDKMMLRALIIPERALTQGEIGARSSVEAFTDIFIQRKQDVLDNIVDTISNYMVQPLVELNWGKEVEIKVKAGRLDDYSKQTAQTIIEKLVEKGAVTPERQWLIDKTGIPLEEKVIQNIPQGATNVKDNQTQTGQEKTSQDVGLQQEKGQNAGTQKDKMKMSEDRWASMTARERKFNLAQMDAYLTSRSEQFQSEITDYLSGQIERIKRYVEKNINVMKPIDLADGITINQNPVNAIYLAFMEAIYQYCYDQIEQGVETGYAFTEADSFMGFRISLSADKLVSDLTTSLKQDLAQSLSSKLSLPDILQNIANKFNEYITGRVTTIAETEIGFTLGRSLEDYIKNNANAVKKGDVPLGKEIKRFVYSAIMDDNVCPLCEDLNGTVVEKGSPVYHKYKPPLHFMCRCTWLPITQDEIDNPNIDNTDLTQDDKGRPISNDWIAATFGKDLKYKLFSDNCVCGH
jgi:SPP1 gp7 family putative phage head morphogenesis protein